MEPLHNLSVHNLENRVKDMHDIKDVIAKTCFELRFGVSRVLGGRKHQEDEYTCVDYLSKRKGPAFFAVFDGHGTDDYAAVASSTFYKVIVESPLFQAGKFKEAIKAGFAQEDKMLMDMMNGQRGGSTSTIAIVIGDELYIGHLGDSRAVLGVEEVIHTHNISSGPETFVRPIRISRDHKPDDPDERRRIIEAGGVVVQGRVLGKDSAIDTSRALGDFDFKLPRNEARGDFISSQPYVPDPIILSPKCKFIVLASDGLWNQMDERTVVNVVYELWQAGVGPNEIADTLTTKLAGPDGWDNVTVIVVFFVWDKITAAEHQHNAGHSDEIIVSSHESRVAP
jgi:serine/threonine protein phosphatase PrpC